MSGLLFITKTPRSFSAQFDNILKTISPFIDNRLYVYFKLSENDQNGRTKRVLYGKLASDIYNNEPTHGLDCRVLMGHVKRNCNSCYHNLSQKNIEFVFTDSDEELPKEYFKKLANFHSDFKIVHIPVSSYADVFANEAECPTYNYSVVGGTFDNLHSGHKVLLSEAVMLTEKCLTVGVTNDMMLQNKTLKELMEPLSFRMKTVQEFLNDVDPALEYNIVPIHDPYGPTITDPSLQCIIVSDETYKGGNDVNNQRLDRKMNDLKIHTVNLVPNIGSKDKLSSTQLRQRKLGTLLKVDECKPFDRTKPYVIGLTGGIASGKSSVAKRLQKLGAHIIDCDKLGHKSYAIGSAAYESIIEHFGSDVIDSTNGEINRKILAKKVFANPSELQKLNQIVWPEIERLVREEIDILSSKEEQECSIVVVDAALLLEAGWQKLAHQVWVCIIPKEEAVKRIIERNHLSETEAIQRIESQMTGNDRSSNANLIFCTSWDESVTQKQVEKAWNELKTFLNDRIEK